MASVSRLNNARRNLIKGLIKQLSVIILNFAVRTAILYALNAEYQGLSDLFTSILHVLNMSDLGFSAAVTYVLYKPIANEDQETICAIIAFLKKVYRIVGLVIFGAGVVVMPFLPNLISGSYPSDLNLYALFALYLFNTGCSYFLFAYKSTLLTALQRDDLVSNAYTISFVASRLIQIVLLFLFHNYYLFVLILPLGSIANNLLLEVVSRKRYPNLVPDGRIDSETKKELIKQVKAVFINRMCDIARNSFDNIILSALVGLVVVAIYDNYYYIYSAIYGVMGIIAHAIIASVGNSLVTENVEKNYNDMQKFTFAFMWIVGWCTICLGCLYQPFMSLWMNYNQEMLLSTKNMLLFCLYFYAISMTYTKGVYLEAKGLYWECRKWYIIEAIGNLLLNILLCHFFGVTGILAATILTIFFFNFLGGTSVLFKNYFVVGKARFYVSHLIYFGVTIANFVIVFYLTHTLPIHGILGMFIRLAICLVVPNIIYLIVYFKTKRFSEVMVIVKRMVFRRKTVH